MKKQIKDCRWPWNRLYLHANGDIKPCCYATMNIGRVQEGDSVRSVWNGDEMTELRKSISQNKLHKVCVGAGCSFVRSKIPKGEDLQRLARYGNINIELPGATIAFARMGRASSMGEVGSAYYGRALTHYKVQPKKFLLDVTKAIIWLRRGDKAGDGVSTQILAEVVNQAFFESRRKNWIKGVGKLLGMKQISRRLALKAAKMGYTRSQYLFGCLVAEKLSGKQLHFGVKDSEAVYWLKKAGDGGKAEGYHFAGRLLLECPKTADEGQHLIDLAIRRGFVDDT